MIATLLLLLSLGSPVEPRSPADCADCTAAQRTCASHLAADRKAVRELSRELEGLIEEGTGDARPRRRPKSEKKKEEFLGSLDGQMQTLREMTLGRADLMEQELLPPEEDEEAQIEVLESIAALTDEHANAPSRDVAEALAAGLEAPSYLVRRRAAVLLARGQHRSTAVRCLTGALDEVRGSLSRLPAAKGAPPPPKKLGSGSFDDIAERMKDSAADLEESTASVRHYFWATRLARELSPLGDERAVRSVDKLYATVCKKLPGWARVAAADALASGAYSSFAAVVDSMRRLEDQCPALHEALTTAARRDGHAEPQGLDEGSAPREIRAAWAGWLEEQRANLPGGS